MLTNFKNILQELRTFMRVRYHQGNDFPEIMELYECTRARVSVLTSKIHKEKLKHLLEIMPQEGDLER